MAILTDCHLHTSFSSDSQTPMEEMTRQALRMGLSHLCITEHLDMDFPVHPVDQLTFDLDTDAYFKEFCSLREKYADSIRLLFGVELGLQPHLASSLTDYVHHYPFDFVIGSSHLCHGRDPYYAAFYEGRSEKEAYREYFDSILENILACEDYDVYGHLDYVVRYGPNKDSHYSYEKYRDILDTILQELIQKGKGIEINTGGLKYGLKDLHPSIEILKRYRKLGGEIVTIGSDAHKPENIGAFFARAEETLKSCGFNYYTIFQNRKPEFIRL